MGEVYRARDTRLQRDVAIKVLPPHVSAAPELRERFEREARAVASLNHPNICVLHDVGRHDETDFLVLEFLDGETLASRLARGQLPLEHALAIATQLADALAAAHRAGVVHRDVKPGNVLLLRKAASGDSRWAGAPVAKLLDFGLAKSAGPAVGPAKAGHYDGPAGDPSDRSVRLQPDLTSLPTTPHNLTVQGTILGTVEYMAPEQIEGQEADARTDIFALGVVVYEMLTGRRAFSGRTHASLISAILKDDPPPLARDQPLAPPFLDHIVRRCLAKDPDERWQTAADLMRELSFAAAYARDRGPDASAAGQPVARTRRMIPATYAAALAVVVAAATATGSWLLRLQSPRVEPDGSRLSIALAHGAEIGDVDNPAIAISPDGRRVVYAALGPSGRQLFLRSIDSFDAQALPATEDASNPFFSPDGAWVGFFSRGKLRKLSIAAGAARELADAPGARGGSWSPDGVIYFAPGASSGLLKVSADGGSATEVTKLDRSKGEVSHRLPHVLPGGAGLMFTVWTGPGTDEKQVDVLNLATGERHTVAQGAETAVYASSGHIVYGRADTLMAARFDLAGLTAGGAAVRVAEGVRVGHGEGGQFTMSSTGDLLYLPTDPRRSERRLVWVDRQGRVEALQVPTRNFANAKVSPDGRFAAVNLNGSVTEIGIVDLSRSTVTLLTTGKGSSQAPVWSPDGKRIAYRATRSGYRILFWKGVNDTADEERLATSDNVQTPSSWSADGKWLFFNESSQATGNDLFAMAVGDRKVEALIKTPLLESDVQTSPDGRWLAYESAEQGRSEVFVQPFPPDGQRVQISNGGGNEPLWAPDGRELFYLRGDRMMVVDLTTRPAFQAGTPRLLFEGRFVPSPNGVTGYSISPDGQRFLMVQAVQPEPPATVLHVVRNWVDELKRLAP
jgi:serine/threonine-protein kinase